MSIYPDDIRHGAETGIAHLLLVDDQAKIIIGSLGMDPKVFIKDAISDGWENAEVRDIIKKMMISSNLRDQSYDLAVKKVLRSISGIKAGFIKKQKAKKTEDFIPSFSNTGLS